MPGDDVTLVESSTGGSREEVYRRRHAALPGAGRFVRLVAEGGMGAVVQVEGHPAAPERALALKLLREELLTDPASVARFRRELASHHRLTARLQAPRLAPCLAYDPGATCAEACGVLPFYPEGSLADLVARGGDLVVALRVLADAVEGLQALHGLGTVHRDLCPGNVLVSREGGTLRGVVGDLGVSVPLAPNTLFTEAQLEQDLALRAGHRGFVDPWNAGQPTGDLYAVGATLGWLVGGQEPPGAPDDRGLKLPAPGACREGVSARLHAAAQAVIARFTCRDMAARFATAREAREAVVELAAVAGGAAVEGGRHRLRRAALAAMVVGALAIGGGGAWLVSSKGEPNGLGAPAEAGAYVPTPPPTAPSVPAGASIAAAPPMDEDVGGGFSPRPQSDPGELVAAAQALLSSGRRGEAEAVLRAALTREPGSADGAGLLALLLARQGGAAVEEAQGLLADAVASHPLRGDLRLALARVLAQLGQAPAATALLREAPVGSSHQREIRGLAVTLDRFGHRSR